MATSLVSSFGSVRLNGQTVTISGGRVQVASSLTMMTSDSGAFTSAAVVANTGQLAWTAADNNSRNLSGNLLSTGQALYNLTTSLSGQFNLNQQTFSTIIPTGSGALFIAFSSTFSSIPVVNPSMTVYSGNSYGYGVFPSQVTTSSYICQFTDVVLETGNAIVTYAHI